ncbi:arsenate reductase (glutaredoxin) [Flavobacterium ardleyense]|uniref:arsenate reductase (glutaredoxin) n=1 Tax=Flavobacterium ardleyense TaxID=2038737 RepID=UPI00298CA52B|nr:arsenate reductase (glutaredoxin) [Flavobacterium ardleyense]
MIQIFHNPRCSKSRACDSFLLDLNQPYEIIRYLDNPLNFEELKALLKKLEIPAEELIRKSEKIWIENYKNQVLSEDEIITAMANCPILIERPIIVNGNRAVIGRPLENIDKIL